MGGIPCSIIIDGEGAQGNAAALIHSLNSSCLLVDYLEHDDEVEFNEQDAKSISDFHKRAKGQLKDLRGEIDELVKVLAAKYNR
jgi:hypothetical protein